MPDWHQDGCEAHMKNTLSTPEKHKKKKDATASLKKKIAVSGDSMQCK